MKTVEQWKKEQAEQLVKLETEYSIAESLPITPDSVMYSKPYHWVTYRRKTLREALQLFLVFDAVVPMAKMKASCLELCPEGYAHNKKAERKDGPFACQIEVREGEGFGPNAELEFFAKVGEEVLKIAVKFGPDYIGMYNRLCSPVKIQRDKGNKIISRTYEPNTILYSLSDSLVKWGTGDIGPIKTSATFSYLFTADHDETLPAEEMTHAVYQLTNLADQLNEPELSGRE